MSQAEACGYETNVKTGEMFLNFMESVWNWINNNHIASSLIVLAIGGIARHFLAKKKEAFDQRRPVLEKLLEILTETEKEVGGFAGQGTLGIINGHKVPCDGTICIGGTPTARYGEYRLSNVNDCGGPLSYVKIESLSLSTTNFDVLNGEKFFTIKDSLKQFSSSLREFNKRWPGDGVHSIEFLEKKNQSKISDEATVIGQEASLLKEQLTELRHRIESKLKKKWWQP